MLTSAMFTFGSLLSFLSDAPGFSQLFKEEKSIKPLTLAQISWLKPFTMFASTAYCNPSTTIDWSCHALCAGNSDFKPVASGGNGGSVQYWYVGFSPSLGSVIVAHQGTDTSKIESMATDADLFFESLNSNLFPGISSSVQIHSGFANEQAKTAKHILAAVQATIAAHGATQVTMVGHSLGAAISLLDAVYLPLHIKDVSFKLIGYGMPRVGNQEFANYVDANLNVTHINNGKDPVPILPYIDMGYHHPVGEVHIMKNQWLSCPGQDNASKNCSTGYVLDVFNGNTTQHGGPFDGVVMGIGC